MFLLHCVELSWMNSYRGLYDQVYLYSLIKACKAQVVPYHSVHTP